MCVTFNAYWIDLVRVHCTYLCSRFLNCVLPYTQDLYAKGKAKSGGDKSEMDWDGFEFVMKKVAGIVGVDYRLIHTYRQTVDAKG